MLDNTKHFWQNSWEKHLNNYLLVTPRTGVFIKSTLNTKISSILEIACGSSRDSIFLSKAYPSVTASDFSEATINSLKKMPHPMNLAYMAADAGDLPFDDDQFDLVFHNGFFVLFNDDNAIKRLLIEQERVSRKYILIFVHNKFNRKLVSSFQELSKNDKLYDIRFFYPTELYEIIINSGINWKNIKLLKFGGPSDRFRTLGDGFCNTNPFRFFQYSLKSMRDLCIPRAYQLQTWSKTERIACLIELDK